MKIHTWIIGIIFAIACSNSKSELTPNQIGIGGTTMTSGGVSNISGNSTILGGSFTAIGGVSAGGMKTSIPITGGSASGGNYEIAGLSGVTYDPPPATGGSGETEDPPIGGSGNTEDPPIGDTEDPPLGDTTDPPGGDTEDPPGGDTGDPPPGDTYDPPPKCTMTEIDKVNVIVFKDATPSGADVEGKMWVGGNATFSGYGVASKETAIVNCSDWGLVVGGRLEMSGGSVNGKIAYGTTADTGNAGVACGVWKAKPVDFITIEAKLKGYSAALKAYPTNGVAVVSGGYLTLTGTSSVLNIFNITAAQLNNNIKIVAPVTSSVIVNVSGMVITWSGVGFSMPDGASCRGGTSDWCHRILWNLYEAKTVQLSGIGVQGSVLAPYATVDGGGGNIDGQLVCEYLKGGIEYHPYFFTGCLILPKA